MKNVRSTVLTSHPSPSFQDDGAKRQAAKPWVSPWSAMAARSKPKRPTGDRIDGRSPGDILYPSPSKKKMPDIRPGGMQAFTHAAAYPFSKGEADRPKPQIRSHRKPLVTSAPGGAKPTLVESATAPLSRIETGGDAGRTPGQILYPAMSSARSLRPQAKPNIGKGQAPFESPITNSPAATTARAEEGHPRALGKDTHIARHAPVLIPDTSANSVAIDAAWEEEPVSPGAPQASSNLYADYYDIWGLPNPIPADRPPALLDITQRMASIEESETWEPIATNAENRIQRPLNHLERTALSFFTAMIDRFEAAGDEQAASNLRRYLGGSRQDLQIPQEFMGPGTNIRRGIEINVARIFELTAAAKLRSRTDINNALRDLAPGESYTFSDFWKRDYQGEDARARGNTDEHNAFGAGGVNSHYWATATRHGDHIVLVGLVEHGPDPNDQAYDFGYTGGMASILENAGIAAPFNMVFEEHGAFEVEIAIEPGSDGPTLTPGEGRYRTLSASEFFDFMRQGGFSDHE